ncbi:MAG: hypothetical protein AAGA08_01500 [Pseudomonadota bacterium]
MKSTLLVTLLTLYATQAAALSCMEASIAQQFIWAKESPDRFVIVKGQMQVQDSTKKTLSKDIENDTELYGYRAQITGMSLSKQGFVSRFTSPVLLELSCIHGWCGSLPDARERIYFLKKDKNRYIEHAGACDFSLDRAPSAKNVQILQRCISGGPCKP